MNSIVIGVAGGTGSGKSTFTNKIKEEFGDQIAVVYHDNYYKSRDDIPFEERKKINYDHSDALETDLLVKHIKMLKASQAVDCPVYDYSQHNRSKETVRIELIKATADIVINSGMNDVVFDMVRTKINELLSVK